MTTSPTKRLSGAWRAAILILISAITYPVAAVSINLVSHSDSSFSPSLSSGGDSGLPIISANGRYVLYASTADNLALISNSVTTFSSLPRPLNVFLRDRNVGSNVLVSVSNTGNNGGNGDSWPVGISTNGQYALFESTASNLVDDDTNNVSDVFVRDLLNGITYLASVSTNGNPGNGVSRNAVMTPDGRYVAFISAANNLATGDTNKVPDVFLRDLQTLTTTYVSLGAISTNSASAAPGGSSESPVITPDGRHIAFFSTATNLVSGVQTVGDVYVRDVVGGTTAWASVNARSIFFNNVGNSNAIACNQHISDDGQFVAFVACTNRVTSTSTRGIALRHHLQSGVTETVHTNVHLPLLAFESIRNLDMTPDGRFIAFAGNVTGFSGADSAIYLWDAQTGLNTLVSTDTNGTVVAGGICDSPAVSADGRFVAFVANATGLVTNTLAGEYHLYRRDLVANVTSLVDSDLNGFGVGVDTTVVLSLSANGNLIAFESTSPMLVLNDRNHRSDVFALNFTTATMDLISARHAALPSYTPSGVSGGFLYSLNTDGRYVAFASEADDLVTNDGNGLRDVFVRDQLIGTNILVSVGTNGFAGEGYSTAPSISGDGRYVAFSSYATNLTANDTSIGEDVYVRDLQSGAMTLASVSTNGINPGNKDSYLPTISADGRYVMFRSKASNLAAGSFGNGIENLFLRDLQSGTNYPLTTGGLISASMTPDGHYIAYADAAGGITGTVYVWNTQFSTRSTNTSGVRISKVVISPDGSRIATVATNSNGSAAGIFVVNRVANTNVLITTSTGSPGPRPGLQFSGDGRFLTYTLTTTNQVFLYDGQSNTSQLVSKRYDSATGGSGGVSDSSIISADGRYVIFRSGATNIVASDTNTIPDLFVYDRLTGTNTLLTQNLSGNAPANNRSRSPVFSGNGKTVVFQSWASDISTNDFNQLGDMYAFAFELFFVTISPASSPAGGKVLTWPATPGETYVVQYKNDLVTANWSPLAGTVNIIGNRAYLTNTPPIPEQRFYRVVVQ